MSSRSIRREISATSDWGCDMQKVHQGEKIIIKASTWNSFIDAANFAKDSKLNNWGKPLKSGVSAGIVLVKNMEAQARDRFTALVITGICISPDANEDEFLSCVPVFEGSKMTEARADKPYVILMEPIASQAIGRAMILGVTPAKVVVNDSEDGFAVPRPGSQTGELESSSTGVARILWKGTGSGAQWCIVQLGGAGSGSGGEKAFMCRVQGGSSTAGYQVTVYPNGRSDEGASYSALLFLPDVALDATLPSGTWIIGHKCAVASTGGNET